MITKYIEFVSVLEKIDQSENKPFVTKLDETYFVRPNQKN